MNLDFSEKSVKLYKYYKLQSTMSNATKQPSSLYATSVYTSDFLQHGKVNTLDVM